MRIIPLKQVLFIPFKEVCAKKIVNNDLQFNLELDHFIGVRLPEYKL